MPIEDVLQCENNIVSKLVDFSSTDSKPNFYASYVLRIS